MKHGDPVFLNGAILLYHATQDTVFESTSSYKTKTVTFDPPKLKAEDDQGETFLDIADVKDLVASLLEWLSIVEPEPSEADEGQMFDSIIEALRRERD